MINTNTDNNIKPIRIGLTGRMGSGKGEVIRVLEGFDFRYTSLSDMVREEVARLGREVSRAQMQDIGNRLRKEGGAGVLGARVRDKILGQQPQERRWVIDGVRNPHEVTELRQLEGFQLWGIDTHIDILLQRIKARRRDTDVASEEELKQRLDREWGIGEPEDGQQVGKCMAAADSILDNNSALENLRSHVLEHLKQLGIE